MNLITPISPAVDSLNGLFDVTYDANDRPQINPMWRWIWLASGVVSAYHGGKRNHGSVWQTVKWGLLGAIFPVFTPIVAVVQGYAKPAGSKPVGGARRRRGLQGARTLTNEYGMTWSEWRRAAHHGTSLTARDATAKERKAWAAGEDPTDWAAHYAGRR